MSLVFISQDHIQIYTIIAVNPEKQIVCQNVYVPKMYLSPPLCVCVCTLRGQNVPTKMDISEILVLLWTYFGSYEENHL